MIRKLALGMSLLTISAGSAFATPAKHHANAPRIVAEATPPAADTATPAADKAEKKTKKAAKKEKADKAAKADAPKEIKAVPAPAPVTQ